VYKIFFILVFRCEDFPTYLMVANNIINGLSNVLDVA